MNSSDPAAKRWLRELALAPVHLYRRLISPLIPQRCKYYPSCSSYAVQAIRELGVVRGAILAAWRLARCNPWSHGGVDEVADRSLFRGNGACAHGPTARSEVRA